MLRLDTREDEEWIKALIYGSPGTGKTNFGVSAPDPLILLSERQGMRHIRDAARRIGRDVPPTIFMQSLDEYRSVIRTLRAPRAEDGRFVVHDKEGVEVFALDHWPKTIVVDSLTDACQLVRDDVYRDAPPQKASDGLDRVTERHWAALRDRCEKLIRAFRDVPAHVLFLCHRDERTLGEGEQATRWVGPMLPMRALPNFLIGAVNVAAVTGRKIGKKIATKAASDEEGGEDGEDGDRELLHYLVTVGPSWMMLKPHRPLKDRENTDFSDWIRRIHESELDDAAVVYAGPETKTEEAAETAEKGAGSDDAV